MARFTYTVTRKPATAAGHAIGQVHTLALRMEGADQGFERYASVQQAMEGAQEVLYYGGREFWLFSTRIFAASLLPVVVEFIRSTEGGETITFDPYGTAAPVSTLQGRRTDDRIAVIRAIRQGGASGGRDDFFKVSFSVREL